MVIGPVVIGHSRREAVYCPSMVSIVTKTGDEGMTGLFGGQRLSKDSARIHAYGTVDEHNATIGLALTETLNPSDIKGHLEALQHMLFRLGGDLATPLEVHTKQDRIGYMHVGTV